MSALGWPFLLISGRFLRVVTEKGRVRHGRAVVPFLVFFLPLSSLMSRTDGVLPFFFFVSFHGGLIRYLIPFPFER